MKPLLWILQSAFRCHHKHMSRVFTIKKRTYQVCCDCGEEFDYSWALMHPGQAGGTANAQASLNIVGQGKVSVI